MIAMTLLVTGLLLQEGQGNAVTQSAPPPRCALNHNSEYPMSHDRYPTIDVTYDDYIEYR